MLSRPKNTKKVSPVQYCPVRRMTFHCETICSKCQTEVPQLADGVNIFLNSSYQFFQVFGHLPKAQSTSFLISYQWRAHDLDQLGKMGVEISMSQLAQNVTFLLQTNKLYIIRNKLITNLKKKWLILRCQIKKCRCRPIRGRPIFKKDVIHTGGEKIVIYLSILAVSHVQLFLYPHQNF